MTEKKRRLIHFLVTVVLISLGIVILVVLTKSKPPLEKSKPQETTPTVRTMQVKTGTRIITIQGEGTVKPSSEINLVPQVDGKVVYVSPSVVNGGAFKNGEILIRIDPADYILALSFAEAKVKATESELKIAEEEAESAIQEWKLHYKDANIDKEKPPPLVAKEPQLDAVRAKLEASRSELQKAKLNLGRTELKAPFNGRVIMENVDAGQYVTPGMILAQLYSTEAVEIVIPMESEKLYWLDVPGFTTREDIGSNAIVRAHLAGVESQWEGEIIRTEGKVDLRTRMINLVVRVDKPYSSIPPLKFGLFVTVELLGHELENTASIPRPSLHKDNKVWVIDENNKIHFRKVEVALYDNNEVIIQGGLADGEMIVTSPLKAVTEGMIVRIILNGEGRLK